MSKMTILERLREKATQHRNRLFRMALIKLEDDEKLILRYLAEQYLRGVTMIEDSEFPNYKDLGEGRVEAILQRFRVFDFISFDGPQFLEIHGRVLDAVHQIDNPPPKDYWKAVGIWFRSKWWSVPVFVLLVVLPLIVQWIEMIKAVLKWFDR